MTKQELIKNGITLKKITSMMRQAEKLIAYYNNKYDFKESLASDKEKSEWRSALNRWDVMKAHRDKLKAV